MVSNLSLDKFLVVRADNCIGEWEFNVDVI